MHQAFPGNRHGRNRQEHHAPARGRGMTVRDLQAYFGFEEPQAIYKWQRGKEPAHR